MADSFISNIGVDNSATGRAVPQARIGLREGSRSSCPGAGEPGVTHCPAWKPSPFQEKVL